MRRKDDNRGFTLVELVIAVAILAIAISPLVANFIQSSKLNLKGRKSMNAMNLAQDVMEGMTAYSATELDEIMTTAGNDLTQKILPSASSYTTATKDASSTEDTFIYNINEVQLSTGGQYSKYDMKITVDASSSHYAKYNDIDVAAITKYDNYYDAVYTVPSSDQDAAAAALKILSTNQQDVASYKEKLNRKMNIIIKNEGTESNPSYGIYLENVYSVDTSAMGSLGLTAATNIATQRSGNISKASPDVLPRSVYVYFKGMDRATTAGVETITITNTTGKDITVYLIRTQEKDDVTLKSAYNNGYRCKVEVTSQDSEGNATENVDIVSNLRFNLSFGLERNYRQYQEGTMDVAETPEWADTANGSVYDRNRAVYEYNGATASEAVYSKHIYDGYKKELKNMIYEVTMEIYESGTSNLIATYTGGLSD